MKLAFLCLFATVVSASSLMSLGFESGIATSNQWTGPADGWTSVQFQQTYNNPVVVAGIPSYVGNQEIIVSVKDVTSTGFKFHLHETACTDGGADIHLDEQISWLVAEEGTYTIGGKKFRVGKHANVASSTWTTIDFGSGFSGTPTILSQIQDASHADYFVNLRHKNAGASSFEVYTQGTNAASGAARGDETVGYLVIESGTGSSGSGASKAFAAGITADTHTHDQRDISLGKNFGHANYAIFGNLHTSDGFDPVTLRYTTKSNDKTRVFLHEDVCGDSEAEHTTERVAWFALETGVLVYNAGRTTSGGKCSHTTCKMVDVDSLFPGHLGSGYKVMQITHSNEETVCHKHSNAHDNHGDAAFAWQETGNKLHCKIIDSNPIKQGEQCECHKYGTNGDLPSPQGVNHDLTVPKTTGTATYTENQANNGLDQKSKATRIAERNTHVSN